MLKKYSDAINAYKTIISISPQPQMVPYEKFAKCYSGQGDFQQAINVARKGLKLHPNSSDLNNNLGWYYYKNGDIDKAIDAT